MKVRVCDICLAEEGKITASERYLRWRGHRGLQLDICAEHAAKYCGRGKRGFSIEAGIDLITRAASKWALLLHEADISSRVVKAFAGRS